MRLVLDRRVSLPGLLLALAACGGAPTSKPVSSDAEGEGAKKTSGGASFSAEAEIGAMSEEEVSATFKSAQSKLSRCFEDGSSKLPYLSGEVRFHVRVNLEGHANTVHLSKSTIGDRETERCMIDVLQHARWPAPKGGKEGIAETEFAFDAPSNVRAAVDLEGRALGRNVEQVKSAMRICRDNAGAGPLQVTLYVDTEGAVETAGVAASDAAGERAADCVVKAVKEIKFNSPGSYTGKATVKS